MGKWSQKQHRIVSGEGRKQRRKRFLRETKAFEKSFLDEQDDVFDYDESWDYLPYEENDEEIQAAIDRFKDDAETIASDNLITKTPEDY